MNPQYLLVLLVMVVMGWFAFGVIFNLRRGDAMMRWLQGGLPRIGERTSYRWLGTSVVELVIQKAKKPFRRLETLVVLAPRDVPWIWLVAQLRGRRDLLILRGDLSIAPNLSFDLADPASWTGRSAFQQAAKRGWQSQEYAGPLNQGGQNLQLAAPPGLLGLANEAANRLAGPVLQLSNGTRRLSLRRESPHLEIHLALPDRQQVEAGQFFKALEDLARAVNENQE